jgi:integrase
LKPQDEYTLPREAYIRLEMSKNIPKRSKKRTIKRTMPKYVVLRDNAWYLKIDFPSTEKYTSGRPRRIQVKRRCEPETEERAAELADEIKAEYAALLSGNTSPIVTLGDFCRRFLGAKRAAVSRRTHDYYQGIYDRFLAGTLLASTPINDVRLLNVQDFYDNLFRTGRASAVMLKKIDVFLSMVFRQAMAWEAAIRNPTTAAILPKQSPPEIVALERAQVKTFLEACRSNHKFFIFEFALETFMRPQEYLGLRWSDIDFDQNLIRVQRAIADNFKGGGREIKATKTRHGRRTVAISAQLTARLHEHRALQIYHVQQMRERAQRPALLAHMERTGKNYRIRLDRSKHAKRRAAAFEREDLVFPSTTGSFQTLQNLNNRLLAEVLDKAGLTGLTVYSLRHTGISLALDGGANAKAVSERAGHASVAFTLQTYAHVLTHSRQEVATVLAGLLHGGDGAKKAAKNGS